MSGDEYMSHTGMYDFTDKVAVVTGAAQGIGRAVAERLATEGSRLVVLDINEEGLQETASMIRHGGGEAQPICMDVRDSHSVQRIVADICSRTGKIDFLVNVAGVGVPEEFLYVPEDDWDRTIDINLKGVFLMCQVVGRRFAEQHFGKIVNIASIAGKTGSYNLVPYSASKGGVIVLTQAVSKALAPFGVNVNAVCPGLVWTPMWKNTATWIGQNDPAFQGQDLSPEAVYGQVVKSLTPLGLPTTVEDIAAAVAFLLSDEAKLITGQAVNVDGGIEVH